MQKSIVIVLILLFLIAACVVVWLILTKGHSNPPPTTKLPDLHPLPPKIPSVPPVPPLPGTTCAPGFKLVEQTCKELCGGAVCRGDETCVDGETCLPSCGTGTCAADQACVTLDNVDCSDHLYSTNGCTKTMDANRNCVLSCDGMAGKAIAKLCHQSNNCKYDTSAVQPLPGGVNVKGSTLFPVYVTDEWERAPNGKTCFDAYKGLDSHGYCLSEVLFSNFKGHSDNPEVALEELQWRDRWTPTIRSFGQSEKGYYCTPPESTGWRYSLVPAPHDSSQCKATDCLMHALSSQSAAKVWYDQDSKACMSASCTGEGCPQIKCTRGDEACSSVEVSGVAKECQADVSSAKKICEHDTNLTCGGVPDKGVQMWVKDSDKVKVYVNQVCTKTNDTSERIWADGPGAPHFWDWPNGIHEASFVDGQTAFDWWKNKGGGVQLRAEHWGDMNLGSPLVLKEPPGHGLNEVFFNWYGCSNAGDMSKWGHAVCWQDQVDCLQSDDTCGQNDKCPKDLADGKCLSREGRDCPNGSDMCSGLEFCTNFFPAN